ncbi:MAG TPA: glycosyltransferase family 39 protein [Solirubrobacteraceae bacterium]|jgi:4-amino-4-deoxy-L-arabinose transferase-like glycosyltransferase|nr:glycosyltransferase family 39 protein [Solirubrobacteraceae bacterium]
MSTDSTPYRGALRGGWLSTRSAPRVVQAVRARPELLGVLGIAAALNLWGLSVNGWANTFYSAAVRSMSTSWHDFLFASLDKTGLMTVDKPPLSLWVQALSARIFGFHPLSILIPQALMGVAAAGLTYDLTRRRFGRPAGFAAGIVLALTPITVAMSRHNNPDELLTLCCVAALWFAVRALEDGRTKWLVLSGLCVGLGFETKMAVALFVVPGIALAYLWVAPRGRIAALRQLLAGGAVMAIVGLAWPILVTLTPAADRPWISGTADNSIWSLIFNYNGVGRVTGQAGAPAAIGGGGGGASGGATGVFRLLGTSLGDQAGWLIGFAVVAGLGVLVVSRLRRRDPRTGWLIAVGGAFLVSAAVFSDASGIFHPYYVSFLAPFTAALVGAGVGEILAGGLPARILAPLAIGAGAITELVVLGNIGGDLEWAKPLIIGVAGVCAVVLAIGVSRRFRLALLGVALAALLAAPGTWAAETLGHATSSTFPAGGPATAGFGGGPGGFGGGSRGRGFRFHGGAGGGFAPPTGGGGFAGAGGSGAAGGGVAPQGAGSSASSQSRIQSLFGSSSSSSTGRGSVGRGFAGRGSAGGGIGGGVGGRGGFGGGGMFGGDTASLTAASKYVAAHGGGTIGVESQSSASDAILSSDANVAGLGGFSGRESSVTASWIAMEVRDGRLRWLLAEGNDTGGFGGLPGDSRQGSAAAIAVAEKVGRKVTFTSNGTQVTLYDLQGKAAAILAAAGQS